MYYNGGNSKNNAMKSEFLSVVGVVTDISNFSENGCTKMFELTLQNGSVINLVVNANTYFINNSNVDVGMQITGFYNANSPTVMIYPPRYNTLVVAINSEVQNIKVDRFRENLVSKDNKLKLNISDRTVIVLENGQSFLGDLAGRNLIILYGVATKSIPAITTPTKIVVLCDL